MSSELLITPISDEGFLAAIIVAIVLAAIFVAIRVANTYTQVGKRLQIDDWFAILAVLMMSVCGALYYTEWLVLDLPTTSLTFIGRSIVATGWLAGEGSWFSKAPILILYIRIFGIHRWLRIISYTLLATTFVLYTAAAIYGTVICAPDNKVLDADYLMNCINPSLKIGVYNGTISLFSDIVIFILPIPVIAKLQLPLKKKIGVAVVFLTGIFGIIANAISLYYRGTSLAGVASNEVGQMLGQVYETSIAIVVGCVPAIRSFWCGQIANGSLYARLHSAFSGRRFSSAQATEDSQTKAGSRSSYGQSWDGTNEHSVRVSKSYQVEHHDTPQTPQMAYWSGPEKHNNGSYHEEV